MNDILKQLEINETFFYQFGLFFLFFIIVSQLYLKPFQRLIEKREKRLKNDVESSADLLKTIESKMREYEASLANTRAEAIRNYERTLQEVRDEEDRAIHQLKDELKKDYTKAAQDLQEERLKVESELKLQLAQTSDVLVQKILAGG